MKRLIPILAALALTGCAAFPSQMAGEQSKDDALTAQSLRHLKENIARDGVPTEKDIAAEDARLEREFWEEYQDERRKVQAGEVTERDFFFGAKDSWDNTRIAEVEKLRERRASVLNELELRAKANDIGSEAWEEAQKKAERLVSAALPTAVTSAVLT